MSLTLNKDKSKIIFLSDGSLENLDYIKIQFTEMAKERVLRPLRMICIMFIICITAYCWAIRPYQIGELKKMGSPVDPKLVLVRSWNYFGFF